MSAEIKPVTKAMKIAVINFSGNVGKSTLTRHFIAPRLGVEPIIIETINSHEGGDKLSVKKYDILQDHLMMGDTAAIDVGSSNSEAFIAQMTQFRGSHRDFDYFAIPVVPIVKQFEDTIKTIETLAKLGVPAKKIRVIFNMVPLDGDETVEELFQPILAYAEAEKKCIARPEGTIYANPLFPRIKNTPLTVDGLAALNEDELRAKMKSASKEEGSEITSLILNARLAIAVKENLDDAFKVVFK